MKNITLLSLAVTLALVASNNASAKVTPAEAAKLGVELTPVGGELAGNTDGSIPKWTGGITEVPAGYKVGDHHQNPYANDKIKYTVTAKNVDKY